MGTTTFVWDPVFDCVTHELDENNDVKAVYHNEPQQYGGVLGQRRGTTSHYHHHDALGSTRFLTDSSGNVTDTYLHDAWGNLVASTGTTVNPFKWVGKCGYYTDDSTGQVYVRARMYQPTVSQWTSDDRIGFFDGLNLSVYVRNSPMSHFDPSGMKCAHSDRDVDFVADRGSFILVQLQDNFSTTLASVDLTVVWEANPERFKDGDCCCCNEVSFVQVVVDKAYTSTSPFTNWVQRRPKPPYVDGGGGFNILYPHVKPSAPCTLPAKQAQAQSQDVPQQLLHWNWQTLEALYMEFETCVVCVNGIEGMKYDSKLTRDDWGGNLVFTTRTSIISYGCVRWGYAYSREGNDKTMWVETQSRRRGIGSSMPTITVHDLQGKSPSDSFIAAVKMNSFEVHEQATVGPSTGQGHID